MPRRDKFNKMSVRVNKLPQSKIYDYIRRIEIDGWPRVRAYAEVIDKDIYNYTPQQIVDKLDRVREGRSDYNDIKEMVLAEQKDWNLRRSSALQDKALTLLGNLIDKANELATKPEADTKELSAAINTLKTIMPALTNNNSGTVDTAADKKARAAKFIS